MHFLAQFQGLYVIPVMAVAGLLAGLVLYFLGDPDEMDLIVKLLQWLLRTQAVFSHRFSKISIMLTR